MMKKYALGRSSSREFEVLTAIGFVYFKKKNADIVILECGMGGRLDSTNVIPSSILSIISFDSFIER